MSTIKQCLIFSIWLCITGLSSVAMGGEGIDRLQGFYESVKSLRADFHQVLLDVDGNTIQESDGSVQIQRPGKFFWDYKMPYPQQIVTNGAKLWIYDSDLEQVTVKSAQESLGNAPALILSGKRPLQENFVITEQGEISGYLWVELKPVKADNEFSIVRLGFDDELALMEVIDGFGQTTRLWLKNVVRNPDIDSKLFDFIVPKGVDVVGE